MEEDLISYNAVPQTTCSDEGRSVDRARSVTVVGNMSVSGGTSNKCLTILEWAKVKQEKKIQILSTMQQSTVNSFCRY